jgi:hypothetical protein
MQLLNIYYNTESLQNRYRVYNDHETLFPSVNLCNQDKATELVKCEATVGPGFFMRIRLFLYRIETPPRHTAPHLQGAHRKNEIIYFISLRCHKTLAVVGSKTMISCFWSVPDTRWLAWEIYAVCCRKAIMDSAEFRVDSDIQNKLFDFKHSRNVTATHKDKS